MAPREGNSIVKHGVLDERLNVHGVQGLKVADLSICPDNVGCNTYVNAHPSPHMCDPCTEDRGMHVTAPLTCNNRYSTALLIGEKCAVLTAEDLGYSGEALEMKVPTYNAPGETALPFRV